MVYARLFYVTCHTLSYLLPCTANISLPLIALEYSLVMNEEDITRPFPQQILEALSAYQYLLKTMDIPPSQIVLVGDSAGGHLALALQRYLSETQSLPSPKGMILLSPWCDLSA